MSVSGQAGSPRSTPGREERKFWLERWSRQLGKMVGEAEEFFGPPGENCPHIAEEAIRVAFVVVTREYTAAKGPHVS
jgi:hypothetical protein